VNRVLRPRARDFRRSVCVSRTSTGTRRCRADQTRASSTDVRAVQRTRARLSASAAVHVRNHRLVAITAIAIIRNVQKPRQQSEYYSRCCSRDISDSWQSLGPDLAYCPCAGFSQLLGSSLPEIHRWKRRTRAHAASLLGRDNEASVSTWSGFNERGRERDLQSFFASAAGELYPRAISAWEITGNDGRNSIVRSRGRDDFEHRAFSLLRESRGLARAARSEASRPGRAGAPLVISNQPARVNVMVTRIDRPMFVLPSYRLSRQKRPCTCMHIVRVCRWIRHSSRIRMRQIQKSVLMNFLARAFLCRAKHHFFEKSQNSSNVKGTRGERRPRLLSREDVAGESPAGNCAPSTEEYAD